jgi:hypothetical protein
LSGFFKRYEVQIGIDVVRHTRIRMH